MGSSLSAVALLCPHCTLLKHTYVVAVLCCTHAATALNAADGSGREVISKIMVRLTLFGLLPPSILPMLVSVRLKVGMQQQSAMTQQLVMQLQQLNAACLLGCIQMHGRGSRCQTVGPAQECMQLPREHPELHMLLQYV
jgi:hypothetical protein